jgi:hypothetical protein
MLIEKYHARSPPFVVGSSKLGRMQANVIASMGAHLGLSQYFSLLCLRWGIGTFPQKSHTTSMRYTSMRCTTSEVRAHEAHANEVHV